MGASSITTNACWHPACVRGPHTGAHHLSGDGIAWRQAHPANTWCGGLDWEIRRTSEGLVAELFRGADLLTSVSASGPALLCWRMWRAGRRVVRRG